LCSGNLKGNASACHDDQAAAGADEGKPEPPPPSETSPIAQGAPKGGLKLKRLRKKMFATFDTDDAFGSSKNIEHNPDLLKFCDLNDDDTLSSFVAVPQACHLLRVHPRSCD
jgi:hypothetical protein